MVSPEDCGYTGLMVRNASGGGKAVLYIAPIQEELDTQPLPPDSKSFSNMPKAMCHSCQSSFPLQILAIHVETCKPSDLLEVCTRCLGNVACIIITLWKWMTAWYKWQHSTLLRYQISDEDSDIKCVTDDVQVRCQHLTVYDEWYTQTDSAGEMSISMWCNVYV